MTVDLTNMTGFINGDPWNQQFHHPNSTIVGTVVSLYEVGGFLGGLLSSMICDNFGRRQCIGFGAIFLIVGAILQATSFELGQLMFARIVSGIGVGLQQSAIPILQSEVTPANRRGLYACAYLTMLNFGIVLAYWIDYGVGFTTNSFAWRFPTAFQLVFVIAVFALSFVVVESPRFLVLNNREEDACDVVSCMLDKGRDDPHVIELLNQIKSAVLVEMTEGSGTWMDFIKDDNLQSRRRLWSACLVQMFQQGKSNQHGFFMA
ncbi:glucose-inactivated glycerol proton symporter STL1 [Sugiyamaella lignohabitans]|uniref:Glucose-inactivated glycerol proton symporter STL1 n=1 Tax=Sugiyamaella lignohabitans TaxID=796027 RepID=A0A170QXM3_9ASCO|nr:glucose-inactivated glycerol proton symporter STL1 [Sugiyamaella lignohabitans]ANB15948.1 glucose-inactivated glycerol proton symporter STL1 [Sugiyamaella lignohabitans]